jgi:hypothetical protein
MAAVVANIGGPSESEEAIRIAKRASGPKAVAMRIFSTTDYSTAIKAHNDMMIAIEREPFAEYVKIRQRLRDKGPTAPMPEFEGVVAVLTQALFQDPEYLAVIEADDTLQKMRELLVHSLMAIQTIGRYMYPYKATVMVIEQMLNLCDVILRKLNPGLANYYHNLRYRLYLTQIVDDVFPDAFVMPTVRNIGTTFLIKTRPVPIMFLGVAPKGSHADQYHNSPIDFWAHDVQHSRRLLQENQRYYDIVDKHIFYYTRRSPFNIVTMDEFYLESEQFSKSLYPLWTPAKGDDEKTLAYKQLKKLIIFEVIHEKAWPLTKFSLCRNIPLGYDIFAIETFVEKDGRLAVVDESVRDPTTLSNMYHKLRKGFYDAVDAPDPRIVNPKYRTARHIALAAFELLGELGCEVKHSFDKIFALTQDPKGAEEFTEKELTINVPNNLNAAVLAANPTEIMPYWQVEKEAPIIKGGKRKTRGNKRRQGRKTRRY